MVSTKFPKRLAQLKQLAEDIYDDVEKDRPVAAWIAGQFRYVCRSPGPQTFRARCDTYEVRVEHALSLYGVRDGISEKE